MKITPEQLHRWYLEATDALVDTPESFNPNARKAYSELSDEQKYIDQYIADRINEFCGLVNGKPRHTPGE